MISIAFLNDLIFASTEKGNFFKIENKAATNIATYSNDIINILPYKSSDLILVFRDNTFIMMNAKSFSEKNRKSIKGQYIDAILTDLYKYLVFCTDRGVVVFNPETFEEVDCIERSFISSVAAISESKIIYTCNEETLVTYNLETKTVENEFVIYIIKIE